MFPEFYEDIELKDVMDQAVNILFETKRFEYILIAK